MVSGSNKYITCVRGIVIVVTIMIQQKHTSAAERTEVGELERNNQI